MDTSAKRRGIIKNALIVFLVIMLILTFFSNTIMNASLPEVAAQYAMSGSITAKIRTNATVKANSVTSVKIEESRKVKAVAVKEGQDVEIGDVLFYLDDAESAELKGAKETLASLERQYELKLLKLDTDYYSEELAIVKKQKELADAKAVLASLSGDGGAISALRAQIDEVKALRQELSKTIAAYEKEINKLSGGAADTSLTGEATSVRLAAAKTRFATAESRYMKAEIDIKAAENLLKSAEKEADNAKEHYDSIVGGASSDYDSLREQIAALEKEMRRAEEDYEIAYSKLGDGLAELKEAWDDAEDYYSEVRADYRNGDEGVTAEDVSAAKAAADAAEEAYKSKRSAVSEQRAAMKLTYDRGVEDDTARLDKLRTQLSALNGAEQAKSALDAAEKKVKSAKDALEALNEKFPEIEEEYTEAKGEYESLTKLSQMEAHEVTLEGLLSKDEEYADRIAELEEEMSELGGNTDKKAQETLVAALQSELSTMQHNLARRREEDSISAKREELELSDLLADIEEQRALVEKYKANSTDAKIVAETAGQISSLSISNGMETSMGQTLCEIVVTELGYSCEITLSAEQAKRVRMGDTVEVTNSWWSKTTGVIAAIRNDPKNPGSQKIATIDLSGDVAVGQNLSLTIGERGQDYDAVVPNSAIREDNNGKFVLVVEAKSSPLGNRYIARRYDVEVLASDDTNTAVSGLLGSEFIITTSSAPITNGNQVRLVEN